MGEMLEHQSSRGGTLVGGGRGSPRTLPPDIDKKASHHAQELARHPEAIKAVIAEAKKRGDIPCTGGRLQARLNLGDFQAQLPLERFRHHQAVAEIARGQRWSFPAEQHGLVGVCEGGELLGDALGVQRFKDMEVLCSVLLVGHPQHVLPRCQCRVTAIAAMALAPVTESGDADPAWALVGEEARGFQWLCC
jgi:hypothetical protein